MTMNICSRCSSRRRNSLPHGASWSRRSSAASADLEFGRFRVLLRQRQLLADGVPVELGTRAFDILMVLLEADGALVTKEELLSRVWLSVIVVEENIKFHVAALRKALGADRDVIRTEVGRGYRFIGVLRMSGPTAAHECLGRDKLQSAPILPSPAAPGKGPDRPSEARSLNLHPFASSGRLGFWRGPRRCLRSLRSVKHWYPTSVDHQDAR
jgi:DNA-binding winged helix-turn-helix (wHTH) protein